MAEQQPPQGSTFKPGDGDNCIMELVSQGIRGVVPSWVLAYSRTELKRFHDVSFSGEPLSPEAELALYREFDVTDDPRPGILGERHDSTRDLRWLQNAASYYDPVFRQALARLRRVRKMSSAASSAQPRTSKPECSLEGRTVPTAPTVLTVQPAPKPTATPRPASPPAPKPASPSASSPSASAQCESLADGSPPTKSVYEEAHRLGLKGAWSPLVRWMFAWVLRGSGYLSWVFVLLVKLVAVFFDESAGVLTVWVTFVSIQYLCLAYVVDRLAPAAYHLPLPFRI